MIEEKIIQKAEFTTTVCVYWLLQGAMILTFTVIGIPLMLIWLVVGLLFTRRYLRSMECVLTNKALKVKKGILVRVEKTIPLEKITDMGLVQGPIMRLFGLYKLTVETAGQSGQGALVSLTGIVDTKAFRERVLLQRESVASVPQESASQSLDHATNSDTLLTEIRDTLLRIESKMERAD